MPSTAPPWLHRLISIVADALSTETLAELGTPGPCVSSRDVPLVVYAWFIALLTLWPFNFFQGNAVSEDPRGGLLFKGPSIAFVEGAGQRLSSLREFTLLVRYQSDEVQADNYNTVLVLERDRTARSLLLRRQRGRAIFSMVGLPYPLVAEPIDDVGKAVWAAVRSERTECRFSVGSVEASVREIEQSTPWSDPQAALVFGSEADGHFTWSGTLAACAVLSRVVSDTELQDPQKLLSDSSVVLAVRLPQNGRAPIESQGGNALVDLRIPARFAPYSRTVLLHPALYFASSRLYLSDIALNVLLFIPFGCLVAASAIRRDFGWVASILIAGGAALALSGSVEIAQAYLPGRYSSLVDVMTNALGSLGGGILCAQGTLVRSMITRLRSFLPAG